MISRLCSGIAIAIWARILELDRNEGTLTIALALLTVAAWPRFGRQALAIPGVVLLWIVLPVRKPFVMRPMPKKEQD